MNCYIIIVIIIIISCCFIYKKNKVSGVSDNNEKYTFFSFKNIKYKLLFILFIIILIYYFSSKENIFVNLDKNSNNSISNDNISNDSLLSLPYPVSSSN